MIKPFEITLKFVLTIFIGLITGGYLSIGLGAFLRLQNPGSYTPVELVVIGLGCLIATTSFAYITQKMIIKINLKKDLGIIS